MHAKTSIASGIVLGLSMLALGVVGALAGIYGAIHLGLALYGDYTYLVIDSPLGYGLLLTGAALGVAIPLGVRSVWRHFLSRSAVHYGSERGRERAGTVRDRLSPSHE
jgi:hypothetical protein